jgi:hypothetical protein
MVIKKRSKYNRKSKGKKRCSRVKRKRRSRSYCRIHSGGSSFKRLLPVVSVVANTAMDTSGFHYNSDTTVVQNIPSWRASIIDQTSISQGEDLNWPIDCTPKSPPAGLHFKPDILYKLSIVSMKNPSDFGLSYVSHAADHHSIKIEADGIYPIYVGYYPRLNQNDAEKYNKAGKIKFNDPTLWAMFNPRGQDGILTTPDPIQQWGIQNENSETIIESKEVIGQVLNEKFSRVNLDTEGKYSAIMGHFGIGDNCQTKSKNLYDSLGLLEE